ncbi:MAG: YtxH domain-containing protein [Silvibacterium sp.]|nr:YtxH domain-containing protein [Silvibacterium sp.]MBV8437960.1 YtxH domain-containing protein [Silvibacterium sp.]
MNNAIKFWAVFAVGVAAGAAVSLIYAPQSGAKTRRQLRRGFEDASDYIKDTAETVGEHAEKYIRRGKDAVGDVVDSASNAVNAAKKVIQI